MPQQRTLRDIISARLIEARADLALFSRMAERDPYWRAEVQLAQRRIRDAEDDLQGLRRHQSHAAEEVV